MENSNPQNSNVTDIGEAFEKASNISEFLQVWLSNDCLDGKSAKAFDAYYGGYRDNFPLRMQKVYSSQIIEAQEIVRSRPNLNVLEVGCGLGTESLWLAMSGARVTGIDLREDRLEGAVNRSLFLQKHTGRKLECNFKLSSLLDIPSEGEGIYDLVWMEQTFHHLEPRDEMVKKCAGLLRPGGWIVISEANALNIPLQLQLFIRRGFPKIKEMQGSDGRVHLYGDERITTAQAIKGRFKKNNIIPISVRYFRMFPNKSFFDYFSWLESFPGVSKVSPLFTHFNYVGMKEGVF